MTTLEELERTVRLEQHVASRVLAERLHIRVEAMLTSGEQRDTVYSALSNLYDVYRQRGQPVERDAVAEVLDNFDGFCAPDSEL